MQIHTADTFLSENDFYNHTVFLSYFDLPSLSPNRAELETIYDKVFSIEPIRLQLIKCYKSYLKRLFKDDSGICDMINLQRLFEILVVAKIKFVLFLGGAWSY